MQKLPLRPNVCMLVFNSEGKLFLGERHKEAGIWQFPQGGVEDNFSLEQNVLRELEEELGAPAKLFKIIKQLSSTHEYEFDHPPEYAKGVWRGQSQTFWLVQFLGKDSDIKLEQQNPEFMNWRWCCPEEVRKLAEPKRLPGYLKPLSEFEQNLGSKACNS